MPSWIEDVSRCKECEKKAKRIVELEGAISALNALMLKLTEMIRDNTEACKEKP